MIIDKKFNLITILMLAGLLLAACAPGATPTPTLTPTAPAYELETFLDDLRATGADVNTVEEVEQPFFSVPAQVIEVNGMQVQVFEYPNETARQQDSDLIAPDGRTIGDHSPAWTDLPNFWAEGRLIVLFVGTHRGTIQLLNDVLGDAVTTHTGARGPAPPLAATQAEIALSEEINVPREEIIIADWEPVDWTDSCLSLGRPDEGCAQVITPGYRVVLEAQGKQYVAHTDEEGQQIRFESVPLPRLDTPTQLVLGEFPLEFYGLALGYDSEDWSIEPGEGNFNILSHAEIQNCFIREQGPTEPNPPQFTVTLDGIVYDVYEGATNGELVRWYLAREGFDNPNPGTIPILILTAPSPDSQQCIEAAHQVLANLVRPSP